MCCFIFIFLGSRSTQLTFLSGGSAGTDLTQIIGWGEPAPDLGPGPDPDPQPGSNDDIFIIDSSFVRNWTVSRSKVEDTDGGNDTDALDIAFLSRVDGALTLTEDWFA
ncbi:hypothetical protein [Yoonia sediminilitoris]|uniref:Uncharacterized protein n=1 Tax=Yoonia sediminilitoris TaxID=1286148 RepID=A0A2T6KFZ9_9RHOB|nr:hypothetical protein [Yoonia sediminilitoris]PUB14252.1 hypothetical protein C8N45_106126 [Yoonia sediminilitoris]RCW95183.1 hypothetical protein DFP92_106126 [Yoonia sediminilitoris]